MKKFLFLCILMFSVVAQAQAFSELSSASWPNGTVIDVPVYVHSSVPSTIWPPGIPPPPGGIPVPIGIVNQALSMLRASGSKYRYYYAGTTSATSCQSSFSVITVGTGYASCANGNFQASIGTSTQFSGDLPGHDAVHAIFASAMNALTGTGSGTGSLNTPASRLNATQGGLASWPIVRKQYLYGWYEPQRHAAFPDRSLGHTPFACADNTVKDSIDCVDVDTVGNLRFMRTSRSSPAAMQYDCQGYDIANCYAILHLQTQNQIWVPFQYTFTSPTNVWFDARVPPNTPQTGNYATLPGSELYTPTPAIVRDHVRNKTWVFMYNAVFTSDDNGRNWTFRGRVLSSNSGIVSIHTATYDPISDRIVAVGIDAFTVTPSLVVATIPAGVTPVYVSCGNTLYAAFNCGSSSWGPDSASAWTITKQLLAPSRLGDFTGTASILTGRVGAVSCGSMRNISGWGNTYYCSLIYSDGSRSRTTRELVFAPHDSSFGKAWAISANAIEGIHGWPNGVANNNGRSNGDVNGMYVLNDQNDLYSNGRYGNTTYSGWSQLPPAPGNPLNAPKAIFGLSMVDRQNGVVFDLMYRGQVVDQGCYFNGAWYPITWPGCQY